MTEENAAYTLKDVSNELGEVTIQITKELNPEVFCYRCWVYIAIDSPGAKSSIELKLEPQPVTDLSSFKLLDLNQEYQVSVYAGDYLKALIDLETNDDIEIEMFVQRGRMRTFVSYSPTPDRNLAKYVFSNTGGYNSMKIAQSEEWLVPNAQLFVYVEPRDNYGQFNFAIRQRKVVTPLVNAMPIKHQFYSRNEISKLMIFELPTKAAGESFNVEFTIKSE